MKILNKISLVLFVVLVVCCAGFVVMRSHMVLNRFTDSWWHIAVADEYAKTGVFAKDPFIEDAPAKFAQFGLMDFCNAWICKIGLNVGAKDILPVRVFVWCVAGNVMLFLVGAFMAGFWINKSAWQGLVAAVAWMLLYPGQTIINLGFPFATAVALLGFFMVSVWSADKKNIGYSGLLWRGLLLGIIFDIHVFIGAVGCLIAGVWMMHGLIPYPSFRADAKSARVDMESARADMESARADMESARTGEIIWKIFIFAGAFLLVSWRWIVMQVGLRSSLSVNNAHMREALPLDKDMLWIVLGMIIMLVLIRVVYRFGARENPRAEKIPGAENIPPARRIINSLLIYGFILLVLAVPPVNNLIMHGTSWYMAHRILWLFPVGLLFSFASDAIFNCSVEKGRKYSARTGCGIVILLGAVILLPAAKTWAMKQLFLARTDEYDVHQFEYLYELNDLQLAGKIVLSDPVTSYYLRGMTGAYVCTVIPGEGSPALDYGRLNKNVRDAFVSGNVDYSFGNIDMVLFDIKNDAMEHFVGKNVDSLLGIWEKQGWGVVSKTDDMILLCR